MYGIDVLWILLCILSVTAFLIFGWASIITFIEHEWEVFKSAIMCVGGSIVVFGVSFMLLQNDTKKIDIDAEEHTRYVYRYQHRFDSDVVILSGSTDSVNSQLQDYTNNGYTPQGGVSMDKYGNVSQTVIRTHKEIK